MILNAPVSLADYLQQGDQAYTYAYPHKSAYALLAQPVPLAELWQGEARDDLFLYVHIPFCHYRCGFCNLFALGAPKPEIVSSFLTSLQKQIKATAAALGAHRITRLAIGGGTPSYLTVPQFEQLMQCLHQHFNLAAAGQSFAIEVAPDSASFERLQSYKNAGVTRISMGVQSFVANEMDALARPRQQQAVLQAFAHMRQLDFATINLDLIYGIEGQTKQSFEHSIQTVLQLAPEELFLYPLYVRKLTGLAKAERTKGLAMRAEHYRHGQALLRAAGYRQQSTRLFKRADAECTLAANSRASLPEFACQTTGMVGLGAGARSYTKALHYSEEYAVSRAASQVILQAYRDRTEQDFALARYGFVLDAKEQRRRYLLQSLLMWPGLDIDVYTAHFGSSLANDFPQLSELVALGLADQQANYFALTESGMAQADAIGPWLYSEAVQERMNSYEWR